MDEEDELWQTVRNMTTNKLYASYVTQMCATPCMYDIQAINIQQEIDSHNSSHENVKSIFDKLSLHTNGLQREFN